MAYTGNGRELESDVAEHDRVINLLIGRIKHYESKIEECRKYNVRDQLPINEAVWKELNQLLMVVDDKRERNKHNFFVYPDKPE